MAKKVVNDLQLIELNKNGYSDKEISEITGIKVATISSRRIVLNLKPNRCRSINYDLFISLYNQNLSDREISEKMQKKFNSIQGYRLRLRLLPNKKNIDKMVIKDKDELINLFNAGYSISEMSEILGVNKNTLGINLRKLGLMVSVRDESMRIEPSERQKSIIVGTLLGDSSMQKSGVIVLTHSTKQLEYLEYKRFLLKNMSCSKIKHSETKDKRTNKVYFHSSFIVRSTKFAKEIFEHLYQDKKIISKKILEYYNEEAMAMHFMDDGCVAKPYNTKYHFFATNAFSYDSVCLLKEHIKEKFNLDSRIQIIGKNRDQYELCISGKESNKRFEDIIKPYCIESMYYKI